MKCPIRNKIEVNLAVVKLKHEKGRGKKEREKTKGESPLSWAESERSLCSVASGKAAAGREHAT